MRIGSAPQHQRDGETAPSHGVTSGPARGILLRRTRRTKTTGARCGVARWPRSSSPQASWGTRRGGLGVVEEWEIFSTGYLMVQRDKDRCRIGRFWTRRGSRSDGWWVMSGCGSKESTNGDVFKGRGDGRGTALALMDNAMLLSCGVFFGGGGLPRAMGCCKGRQQGDGVRWYTLWRGVLSADEVRLT